MFTILIMVMASCVYTNIKIYQTVHFKCQLYLNKAFLQKYLFANSHPHDTSLVGFYSELDTEDISTPPQSI